MSDQAPQDPQPEIITPNDPAPAPATLGGVALTRDNMGARAREISLPPITGRESSWALIPHAATLAGIVAGTDFVPRGIRGNAPAIAALMLLGHEVGFGPMASMQAFTITPHKRNSKGEDTGGDIITYAKTLRAIVRSHGHKLWVDQEDFSSTRVRWHGCRRDDPEHPMSVLWTWEDATKAGLTNPPGGYPGPWQKQPRAQLSARASAELCRMLDEDGILGVSRVVEEIDDIDEADLPRDIAVGEEHPDEPKPDAPETAPTRTRTPRTRKPAPVAGETPVPPVPGDAIDIGTGTEVKEGETAEVSGDGSGEALPPIDTPDATAQAASEPVSEPVSDVVADAPTDDQVIDAAQDLTQPSTMPLEQKIAMLCREAGVDRARLCSIISDKRTESAKELRSDEQAYAIEHLRAVIRGEETFSDKHIPPFLVVEDIALVETTRQALAKLMNTEHLRPVLAEQGYVQKPGASVGEWLSTLSRADLVTTLAKARKFAPAPSTDPEAKA